MPLFNSAKYLFTFIIILFLLFFINNRLLVSQNSNTDSITLLLNSKPQNKEKIELLNDISYNLLTSYPEKAYQYNKQAVELSEKINYTLGLAAAYNVTGLYYRYKGNYTLSISFHYKSLELYEKINDIEGIGIALFGIANIFNFQKKHNDALEYYRRALQIKEKLNDKKGIANVCNAIGIIYKKTGKLDTALLYYNKSLNIYKELNEKNGIADALNNIGILYFMKKDTTSTLECFEQVWQLRKETGDKNGEATILYNIGFIKNCKKKHKEALSYFEKSLLLSREIGDSARVLDNYGAIHENYAEMKEYALAYRYFLLFDNLKDYLNNTTNTKQLNEIKTKYETEKKEKEIILLNREKTLQQLLLTEKESELLKQNLEIKLNRQQTEIESQKKEEKIALLNKDKQISEIALKNNDIKMKQQKSLIFLVFSGLVLLIIFFIIVFRLYRHKRTANITLSAQKEEIAAQRDNLQVMNTELLQQKEEIISQRDEISLQRNIIENHNLKITSSIAYARHIQEAILPSESQIKEFFPDFFLLYLPKDIVSGDFYWLARKEGKLFFAVADCTGHGVPGAFMSLLSFNLLNEIIKEADVIEPSDLVNKMSQYIYKMLRLKTGESFVKDGLDIIVCSFDPVNRKLWYSGVSSGILLVSHNKLFEYKSEWLPIGDLYNGEFYHYKNTEIQLKKGDCIYLLTDGYTDQFGGAAAKKYSKKRFKEKLLALQTLPINQQKEVLESDYHNWKGKHEQIDDVLIFGIKIQ